MRVKTVPRHRIVQSSGTVEYKPKATTRDFKKSSSKDEGEVSSKHTENAMNTLDVSSTTDWKAKQSDNSSANDEENKEEINYSTEALDMTIKHKDETIHKHSNHSSKAGPSSCCQYSESLLEKNLKEPTAIDEKNNNLPSNTDRVSYCTLAGSSHVEHGKSHEDESNDYVNNNDCATEAVNLCKKDCCEEDVTNPSGECDDRLKDTFLYKIMTDPLFLESIQKHKQAKKFACLFCKQEFTNNDELTEHMDVKKDESNQVVCCACRKTFAQKRYLRYHQRCHSERTKFTCDICTKKYTRLDNLTRHNTFHVNPDKFACNACEKTFARKDLLNKHLKCHDNKYRFYCETCQKYFKGPLTLDNHKKIFHSAA